MASLRKTRPVTQPYETWQVGSWVYKVLKFYKSRENTIADPYGRVFCEVHGPTRELGDVYYADVHGGILLSTDYPE